MAASKKSKSRSSDGLRLIGREDGKLKYEATLRKKHKGKLIVDTTAIILADSKVEALTEKARRLEEHVQRKLGLRPVERVTLGGAIDEFLPTLLLGTRTTYGSHLKKFRVALGDTRPLDEIKSQELQRVIADVQVSDKTAIQIRVAIRSLYEWAVERGYVAKAANPALDTKRRRTRKSAAERLAEQEAVPKRKAMLVDELNRFLGALRSINPDIYVLAGTQFLLGCRFGEASALRWRDVDLSTGAVWIRVGQYMGELGVPKNGKPRQAAVGPQWLEVLREHRARLQELGRPGADEWCFPAPPNTRRRRPGCLYRYRAVSDAFRAAMEKSGVDVAAVTHSLRHTMITLAQLEGTSLAMRHLTGQRGRRSVLQDIVGHATPEMTETYTHVPSANIVDFAARLEERLRGGGGGKGGGKRSTARKKP